MQLLPGKGAIRLKHVEGGVNYVLYGYFGPSQTDDPPGAYWEQQYDCGSGTQTLLVPSGIWMCSGGKQFSGTDGVLSGTYGLTYTETEGFGCPFPTSQVVAFAGEQDAPVAPRGVGSTDRTFSWNLSR